MTVLSAYGNFTIGLPSTNHSISQQDSYKELKHQLYSIKVSWSGHLLFILITYTYVKYSIVTLSKCRHTGSQSQQLKSTVIVQCCVQNKSFGIKLKKYVEK